MYEYDEITLGEKKENNSAIYFDCFACRRQLKINVNWHSGYNWDSAHEVGVARGWFRRKFHEGADPWFCSQDCAYNSPQAEYCVEYWAKHVKEYDDKNSFIGKIKGWFK